MLLDVERLALLRSSSEPQYVSLRERIIAGGERYMALKGEISGGWNRNLPNAVAALAAAYRLSGEQRYLDELLPYLRHAANYDDLRGGTAGAEDLDLGICLFNLCLALDWCGDALDEPTKQKLEGLLLREAAYAHELFLPYSDKYFWNHEHQVGVGLYAVAVSFPDADGAEVWRKDVETFFETMQTMLDQAGEAVYPEGVAYASIVYTNTAQYNELRRSFDGDKPAHNWWRRATNYIALTRRPDGRGTIRIGDDNGRWFWPPTALLRYSAASYGDARAQALADEIAAAMRGREQNFELMAWQELLFADPRVLPDRAGIPQTTHFIDSGLYVTRNRPEPDAYIFAASSGLPGGSSYNSFLSNGFSGITATLGHRHADCNSVSWWQGNQALLSDPGHEAVKLSAQHNTLTFDGRGQIGEGAAWWGSNFRSRPWGFGGGILSVEDTLPGSCIVEMQADNAYPPTVPLDSFRRRAVWLRSGVLVIMDKVTLSSAQIAEANWLSELGTWEEADGFYTCGSRLGVAVLGQQPLSASRQQIEVRSSFSSQRLQTRFDAAVGETRLVHVFWDSAAGFAPAEMSSASLSLQQTVQGSTLSISHNASGISIAGPVNLELRWDDF